MATREQELSQVIGRYGDMVFRLAFTRVQSRADAEDICQEVFLRWFEHAEPFSSEEHCRGRIFSSCRSLQRTWTVI